MKKNILVMLLLCFLQSFSQEGVHKKAKRLEYLCRKNSRTPDSLFFYGKQLLAIGKEHNHLKAIIEGYFALGFSSSLQAKEQLAIIYLDSAITYKKPALKKYFSDMMRIMRNKAIILSRKGEFLKAEKMFKEIIHTCITEEKMADAAYNYNDLGIVAKEQGKLNLALAHYKRAMYIWDSIGKNAPKTTLLLNIGIVQARQGNYKLSKASYLEGLNIAQKNNIERDIYRFYNNLSVVYRDTKLYDSAYYYLKKIIPYYKAKKLVSQEYLAYMNVGNTLLQQKKLDSAYWYLQKSLNGLKPTQQIKTIAQNYRLLSYVLYHKNKLKSAKIYLDSSNHINKKYNLQTNLAKDYNLYARIYEKLDNYKKANEYYKLEKEINDSIYVAQTAKDYNELLVTQNVQKQKSIIQKLNTKNSSYKSKLGVAALLVSCLSIFSFLVYNNLKKEKKEISQLQKEIEKYVANKEITKANYIHLKSKAVINTNNILYIKSDGHYVEIFLDNKVKPEVERSSLIEILNLLPNSNFLRTHKSFIVNIHKIKIINATQLMLLNGEWIKLSRTYKQQLKDILNKE